jgi:hypothetical protein
MNQPTVSLRHLALDRDERCSVCGAVFIAAEDSGSRVLTITNAGQEPFSALLCGGCHSKWSHGVTVTLRTTITP